MARFDWLELLRSDSHCRVGRARRRQHLTFQPAVECLQPRRLLSAGPVARLTEGPSTVARQDDDGPEFTVRYEHNSGIDIATIDELDALVENSSGDGFDVELLGVSGRDGDSQVEATYRILSPLDGWTRSDNGIYSILIAEGEVLDSSGNEVAETPLGTFEVRLANQRPVLSGDVRFDLPTFERRLAFGMADLEDIVSDPDGDELQIVRIETQPRNGTVVPGEFDGDFVYEPARSFAGGGDLFEVRVSDGSDELVVRVFVDVERGLEPPQISLLELSVSEIRTPDSDGSYELTGVFYDDRNIIPSSIQDGNFIAVGPYGPDVQPNTAMVLMKKGEPLTDEFGDVEAQYVFKAPSGGWQESHNGTWKIVTFGRYAIVDAEGQMVSLTDETVPTFEVRIGETVAPEPDPPTSEHVASFEFRFFRPDGTRLQNVRVGDEFDVQVWVNDLRSGDEQLGLASAYVDVVSDASHLEVLELTNHAVAGLSGSVLPDGTVDEAGGFVTIDRAVRVTSARLITLRVRATAAGTAALQTDRADVPFRQMAFRGPDGQDFDARDRTLYGSAELQIRDALGLSSSHAAISENGGRATLTVQRDSDDVDRDLTVEIASSHADKVHVPSSVTIPAGQTTVTFLATALDNQRLDGTVDVAIRVTGTGYNSGEIPISVTDHEMLTLNGPTEVSEDAGTLTMTLTRSDTDTLDESLAVSISISDPAQLSLSGRAANLFLPLDAQAVIPAGQASVEVTFDLHDNEMLDGDRDVTITAWADGFEPDSRVVTIRDAEDADVLVTSFEVLNDRVDGGEATIRLTVMNKGRGPARKFDLGIVHSDDSTIDLSEDPLVGRVHLDELAAGETRSIELRVDLDTTTILKRSLRDDPVLTGSVSPDGVVSSYRDWLAAVVDPDGSLEENNDAGTAESNNSGLGLFLDMDDVTALPFDLDHDSLVAPLDALSIIDRIGEQAAPGDGLDFDGDGLVAPLDVLTVIDRIGFRLNESAINEGPATENGGVSAGEFDSVRADLSGLTGVPADEIVVVSVEPRTWPSPALGLPPQPGVLYLSFVVEGHVVTLNAGGRNFDYHTGGNTYRFAGESATRKVELPVVTVRETSTALSRVGQIVAGSAARSTTDRSIDAAFSQGVTTDLLLR